MGNVRHSKQTLADGIHGFVAYSYANATARLAATGFVAEDVYKVAIDLDTEYMFVLTDHSPITWQAVGNDAVILKLDDLNEPDDNTDLNASTAKHGLLPKLGGGVTNFLRADGAWAAPVPVFGAGYQRQGAAAYASTTGENTVRVTLTTGALTGTYRLGFGCLISSNNKVTLETLYNLTDAAVLWAGRPKPSTINDTDQPISGAVEIVLTGTSKTIQLRYGNQSGLTDTIGIERAFIEMWRVA